MTARDRPHRRPAQPTGRSMQTHLSQSTTVHLLPRDLLLREPCCRVLYSLCCTPCAVKTGFFAGRGRGAADLYLWLNASSHTYPALSVSGPLLLVAGDIMLFEAADPRPLLASPPASPPAPEPAMPRRHGLIPSVLAASLCYALIVSAEVRHLLSFIIGELFVIVFCAPPLAGAIALTGTYVATLIIRPNSLGPIDWYTAAWLQGVAASILALLASPLISQILAAFGDLDEASWRMHMTVPMALPQITNASDCWSGTGDGGNGNGQGDGGEGLSCLASRLSLRSFELPLDLNFDYSWWLPGGATFAFTTGVFVLHLLYSVVLLGCCGATPAMWRYTKIEDDDEAVRTQHAAASNPGLWPRALSQPSRLALCNYAYALPALRVPCLLFPRFPPLAPASVTSLAPHSLAFTWSAQMAELRDFVGAACATQSTRYQFGMALRDAWSVSNPTLDSAFSDTLASFRERGKPSSVSRLFHGTVSATWHCHGAPTRAPSAATAALQLRCPASTAALHPADGRASQSRLFQRRDSARAILDEGFRLPPHAGMYGRGIYFADCPLKSLQYAGWGIGWRYMLICEVELG